MTDAAFKVLVVGDTAVGKSLLMLRFCASAEAKDVFEVHNAQYVPTLGVDFRVRKVEIEGKNVTMKVWDTAGQERFRAITNGYYRDMHGVLLVYSVADRTSFKSIKHWLGNVRNHAPDDVRIILVGTKADLAQHRVVTTDEGRDLARSFEFAFFETSAKTGENVDEAFMALATEIKHEIMDKNRLKRSSKIEPIKPGQPEPGPEAGWKSMFARC